MFAREGCIKGKGKKNTHIGFLFLLQNIPPTYDLYKEDTIINLCLQSENEYKIQMSESWNWINRFYEIN